MNVNRLITPKEKVRELQVKLYLSAKKSSTRKYHALYDKVYRKDVLEKAWEMVKKNKGSAGIDGQTIEKLEETGIEKLIEEIQTELKQGTYRPKPVKRVEIPKAKNGKKRPLGIPTIKDRIIQTAVKTVIEPIFEADFKEMSYGFRPKRNAHQALEVIKKECTNGGNWVLDADIKGYFDNISHEKLMLLVKKRINDRRILKIIEQWLKAGIMKDGRYEESEIGSPQGGVISPLLANIYLDYLDTVWEKYYAGLGKLIRYADDFVIVCKNYKDVQHVYNAVKYTMKRLELTLSEEKTKLVPLWGSKEGFDFLGYHNRKILRKTKIGKEYYPMEQWLNDKAKKKIKEAIKEVLGRNALHKSLEYQIETLNKKIIGWKNYYGKSRWDKIVQIDKYIKRRLVIWYNQKRQVKKLKDYFKLIRKFRENGLKLMAT